MFRLQRLQTGGSCGGEGRREYLSHTLPGVVLGPSGDLSPIQQTAWVKCCEEERFAGVNSAPGSELTRLNDILKIELHPRHGGQVPQQNHTTAKQMYGKGKWRGDVTDPGGAAGKQEPSFPYTACG